MAREGTPPENFGYPGHEHKVVKDGVVLIERDVTITLRDGVRCTSTCSGRRARPGWSRSSSAGAPTASTHPSAGPLAGLGRRAGLDEPYTGFESNPIPPTGAPGLRRLLRRPARHLGLGGRVPPSWPAARAQDAYELIEWAGDQPWRTGKVGLIGVSYLAAIQWQDRTLEAAAPRRALPVGGRSATSTASSPSMAASRTRVPAEGLVQWSQRLHDPRRGLRRPCAAAPALRRLLGVEGRRPRGHQGPHLRGRQLDRPRLPHARDARGLQAKARLAAQVAARCTAARSGRYFYDDALVELRRRRFFDRFLMGRTSASRSGRRGDRGGD